MTACLQIVCPPQRRRVLPLALPARQLPVALAIVFVLAGCTGSGNVLRGVGTPDRLQSTSAPVQQTVAKGVAREETLRDGTPLNLTGAPAVPDVEPVAIEIPPSPQMASNRQQAVGEIRAKAAATGKNPPNLFAPLPDSTSRMSLAQQEQSRIELQAAAAANAAMLSPGEAEAKAAAARKLKRRAQSHYGEAVKAIEN